MGPGFVSREPHWPGRPEAVETSSRAAERWFLTTAAEGVTRLLLENLRPKGRPRGAPAVTARPPGILLRNLTRPYGEIPGPLRLAERHRQEDTSPAGVRLPNGGKEKEELLKKN
jgi:hypothetical protein